MGNHTSQVIESDQLALVSAPASCKGRMMTSKADAIAPSQASEAGIIRPRRSSQQKSKLPTAKKIGL